MLASFCSSSERSIGPYSCSSAGARSAWSSRISPRRRRASGSESVGPLPSTHRASASSSGDASARSGSKANASPVWIRRPRSACFRLSSAHSCSRSTISSFRRSAASFGPKTPAARRAASSAGTGWSPSDSTGTSGAGSSAGGVEMCGEPSSSGAQFCSASARVAASPSSRLAYAECALAGSVVRVGSYCHSENARSALHSTSGSGLVVAAGKNGASASLRRAGISPVAKRVKAHTRSAKRAAR